MDIHSTLTFHRVRTLNAAVLALTFLLLCSRPSLAQEQIPLATNARWINEKVDSSFSLAWGDVDLDGDLDLAVADGFGPNLIYLNNGRTTSGDFDLRLAWTSAESDRTLSVAWGDIDGDGDLDLAVGNGKLQSADPEQPNRIYRNEGVDSQGKLLMTLAWTAPLSGNTKSVAWGDMDGDGDLDLAVGNEGQANQIYRNDMAAQGNVNFTVVWSAPNSASTTSIAWGDLDGDTDIDLAVGNGGEANLVYRNDGPDQAGSPQFTSVWSSPQQDATTAIALADMDGDDRLDLVVANNGQAVRVYHNNGVDLPPNGQFQVAWSSLESLSATSIALGDADHDGDLDLAIGVDSFDSSRVYMNKGTGTGNTLDFSSVWTADNQDNTQSVAWADVDGDSDLDLAMGNWGQSNKIYENRGSGLRSTAAITLGDREHTSSVALGDMDADGDLDLAAGNLAGRGDKVDKVFRNAGVDGAGNPQFALAWSAPAQDDTYSIAWGDVDGDGDLDLATGNKNSDKIYQNEGPQGFVLAWEAPSAATTYSLAWGDVDGDGDLDLATGGGAPKARNTIYRNMGMDAQGRPQFTVIWESPFPEVANSVAWGDMDGDGDLDLATGSGDESTGGAPTRVFRNDKFDQAGNLRLVLTWSSEALDLTRSVAWGDMDGDGDLDLATGNQGTFNRVYRNHNGQLETRASWTSNDTHETYSIIWGDTDGDGDQDLIAGSWNEPIKIYANIAGTLQNRDIATISDSNNIRGVALGDIDNNGTLDLAVGNWFVANRIYLNRQPQLLSNETPIITFYAATLPSAALAPANGYATGLVQTGELPITYALFNPTHRPVRRVRVEYSLNGGGSWQPATTNDEVATAGLATSLFPIPTITNTHVYTWHVLNSNLFGQSDHVVARLIAYPDLTPTRHGIPGPYQRPYVSVQTFPFRVRGTQVRIVDNSSGVAQPASNTLVYRLPAGQATGALPIADQTNMPYRTDGQGYLQGRGQLALGDRLTALKPISATESYTLYYMSATPTLSGLAPFTVTTTGVQEVAVSAAHPLLLFNLDVVLEWDARKDAAFLEQLAFDLKRTGEFLFDASDGQAALGEITLYHNKENWERADIRIYASNALIPNADPGGIVTSVTSERITSNPFINAITPYSITYQPGAIRIGAVWNRFGEATGTLGEDWPRTLAHELGHYAFYLYDNYLGLQNGVVVPVTSCTGTLMTDQYREDFSEFRTVNGWATDCAQTISAQRSGRADWQTITRFYPWLKLPSGPANPGPVTLPLAVTQIESRFATTPTQPIDVAVFDLVAANGAAQLSGLHAQAVLYSAERLIDLGHPVVDKLEARGAHVGDRLCVYDLLAARLGCETIAANDNFLTLVQKTGWQPEIVVSPVTSRTVSVLVSNVPAGLTLQGKLYPENSAATPPTGFVPWTGGVYSTTFQLNAGVLAGHIQIGVDEAASAANPRRESLTSYALGGSPGKIKKPAKGNKRSLASTDQAGSEDVTPAIAPDGQVLIYGNVSFNDGEFYALQKVNRLPPPPLWTTVVGDGYRILRSANAPDLKNTSILFRYRGQDVPAGEENFLSLYFWDEPQQQWRKLPTVHNQAVNEASAQAPGPGLYVLMSSLEIPLTTAGWNLVAYPVQETRPVSAALASLVGRYKAIYGYQTADPDDPWAVYAPGVPAYVNDLEQLVFGQGYWINATQVTTWLVKGPDTQAVAAAGGLALPPATYYGVVLPTPGFVPTAGLPVQALLDGVVCGSSATQAVDGQIVYTLNVSGDGSRPGCFGAGKPVTFTVAGMPRCRAPWQNETVQMVNFGVGATVYLPEIHK